MVGLGSQESVLKPLCPGPRVFGDRCQVAVIDHELDVGLRSFRRMRDHDLACLLAKLPLDAFVRTRRPQAFPPPRLPLFACALLGREVGRRLREVALQGCHGLEFAFGPRRPKLRQPVPNLGRVLPPIYRGGIRQHRLAALPPLLSPACARTVRPSPYVTSTPVAELPRSLDYSVAAPLGTLKIAGFCFQLDSLRTVDGEHLNAWARMARARNRDDYQFLIATLSLADAREFLCRAQQHESSLVRTKATKRSLLTIPPSAIGRARPEPSDAPIAVAGRYGRQSANSARRTRPPFIGKGGVRLDSSRAQVCRDQRSFVKVGDRDLVGDHR